MKLRKTDRKTDKNIKHAIQQIQQHHSGVSITGEKQEISNI